MRNQPTPKAKAKASCRRLFVWLPLGVACNYSVSVGWVTQQNPTKLPKGGARANSSPQCAPNPLEKARPHRSLLTPTSAAAAVILGGPKSSCCRCRCCFCRHFFHGLLAWLLFRALPLPGVPFRVQPVPCPRLASSRPEKLATCQTKPTASSPPPAALAACFPSGGLLLLPVLFGLKIKTHVSACGAHLHGISKVRATDRTDRADRTDTGSQRTNAIVLARCHRNATAGSSGVVLQPRPAFGVLTPLRCGTFMDYIANRARSSHSYSAVVACLFVCIWRHGGESVNRNMQNL